MARLVALASTRNGCKLLASGIMLCPKMEKLFECTEDFEHQTFTSFRFTFNISRPFRVANAISELFREVDAAIVIYVSVLFSD